MFFLISQRKRYASDWENDPHFRDQLCEKPKKKAYCNLINIDSGGKSDLKKHLLSKKHTTKSKSLIMQPSINLLFVKNECRKRLAVSAELRMAGFIAEHNLEFLSSDHMVPLFESMKSKHLLKIFTILSKKVPKLGQISICS